MTNASLSRHGALSVAAAAALLVGTGSAFAELVRYASADASLREDAPEGAYGTLTPTELTVRVSGAQNRSSLIRFDLTGLTSADLLNFADIRLTHRGNGLGNGNAGGIKIYGLNPMNPLAATWDEALVHYRDAGSSGDPAPSPTAQPAPGALPAPPVAPVIVNSPADYGALVTGNGVGQNPNGAPGVRHETAPYSPNVNSLNVAALATNTAVFNAGTGSYTAYTNQPGYTTTTASGAWSDLLTAGFDRPLSTIGSDLDGYTFLGNLNYDAKTRAAGSVLSFSTGIDDSPINFGFSVYDANRAALVNFLTALLDGGFTSATFMVVQKNAIDADPLPVRGDNLIFASKEFVAPVGGLGAWAPVLVVAPEPGTIGAALLGAATLLTRRRGR